MTNGRLRCNWIDALCHQLEKLCAGQVEAPSCSRKRASRLVLLLASNEKPIPVFTGMTEGVIIDESQLK